MLKLLGHGLAVVLLTLVTQIGGIAYLVALALRRLLLRWTGWPRLTLLASFLLVYGASTLVLNAGLGTPRYALPCLGTGTRSLTMASPVFCLLNRHYVSEEAYYAVEALSGYIDGQFPGSVTQVLDTNFPLFDGFPLLPHLSHDDGRKIDIAFYYRRRDGGYLRGALASPLGYWGFAEPRPGDPQPCAEQARGLTLRWDMGWFQPLVHKDLVVDEERTRAALNWLTTEGRDYGVEKILLEPHLKARLGLSSGLIRFQGCHAARHDDHIHVQVR